MRRTDLARKRPRSEKVKGDGCPFLAGQLLPNLHLQSSLTSSQNDLQQLQIDDENSILWRTKDAVITLQSVLEGKHNSEIEETLDHCEIPKDRWWSSLYKMVEGLAVMSRLARNQLQQPAYTFEDRSRD